MTTVVMTVCHNVRMIFSSPLNTLTSQLTRFAKSLAADFTFAHRHATHSPAHSIEEMEEKEISIKSVLEHCLFGVFLTCSDLLIRFAPVGQEALEA